MSAIVAYRFWRRHRPTDLAPEPEVAAEPDERAEELRTKLAESRAAEPAVEEAPPAGAAESTAEAAEPAAEDPAPAPTDAESVLERRRRVHEEGRAALDEIQGE